MGLANPNPNLSLLLPLPLARSPRACCCGTRAPRTPPCSSPTPSTSASRASPPSLCTRCSPTCSSHSSGPHETECTGRRSAAPGRGERAGATWCVVGGAGAHPAPRSRSAEVALKSSVSRSTQSQRGVWDVLVDAFWGLRRGYALLGFRFDDKIDMIHYNVKNLLYYYYRDYPVPTATSRLVSYLVRPPVLVRIVQPRLLLVVVVLLLLLAYPGVMAVRPPAHAAAAAAAAGAAGYGEGGEQRGDHAERAHAQRRQGGARGQPG